MKFELNEYKRQLTDEEIIQDIKVTAERLEKEYLSLSEYKKNGKFSQSAIQNHFGTWANALNIAGLRTERNSQELKQISDMDYYEDVRRVATIIGLNTVPYEAYRRYGKYAAEHIFSRFGKWNDFLVKAGLDKTGFSKDKITEQDCFNEIERIWRILGRQPTTTDIIKSGISKYSIDTFKRRFGGWRNALEAFVEYINTDDDASYEPCQNKSSNSLSKETVIIERDDTNKTVKHITSRNINTRLRFKVLQRDHFKCCACGASPATSDSVELQVDHIIPWSQGGETVIDNLQTLCSTCNQGKSDVL